MQTNALFADWNIRVENRSVKSQELQEPANSIRFTIRSHCFFSVPHPFSGDYVRLRQNAQWKKLCVTSNDQYIVFADIINKITRSTGKVSVRCMLIMNHVSSPHTFTSFSDCTNTYGLVYQFHAIIGSAYASNQISYSGIGNLSAFIESISW